MDELALACAIERTLYAFLEDEPSCEGHLVTLFEHAQDDHVPEIILTVDGVEFRATIARVPA